MPATPACFRAEVDRARALLDAADSILIGAGAGLSAAAGLLYLDTPIFREWFPGYADRYGLRCIYEATFFEFPTVEEHYAYWARHIRTVRYRFPAGKPYLDLRAIVAERDRFALTTNVDGQFVKAVFAPERVLTPQGDDAYFQCSGPCSDELSRNETAIEAMLAGIPPDAMAIRTQDVPRCPHCGRLLEPNIRKSDAFVGSPWMPKLEAMNAFLAAAKGRRLVLLELGGGCNTPGIIRFPFERLAATREGTALIRVNRDEPGAVEAFSTPRMLPVLSERIPGNRNRTKPRGQMATYWHPHEPCTFCSRWRSWPENPGKRTSHTRCPFPPIEKPITQGHVPPRDSDG
jgi:NAD-dependent SIR2 family protein deacetylase